MSERLRHLFRPQSIRTRLMLWNVGVLALLLGLFGAVIQLTIRSALLGAIDADLEHSSDTVAAQAREFLLRDRDRPQGVGFPSGAERRGEPYGRGPAGPPPGPPPDESARSPQAMRMLAEQRRQSLLPRVFNISGIAMQPYQSAGAWDPPAVVLALTNRTVRSTSTVDGEPMRVLTTPVFWRGHVLGAIQAAHPLSDTRQAIANVNRALIALIPLGLLCAALAGAAVTGRALKPVGDIARDADRIDAQDLTQRLEVEGSDEFSRLAATFNRMLERLDTAFARQHALLGQLEAHLEDQRRFTADAAHELKTPLSIAKVHSGLLLRSQPTEREYRESAEFLEDAVDRMSRLVDDLLLLARAEAGQATTRETSLVVMDLLHQARRLQGALPGPPIQLPAGAMEVTVRGDEDELVRVFANLFANARRHTPEDGEVRVSIKAGDGRVAIAVADTGEGIAPEHIPHLGDRFYRIDSARSRGRGGAGLGLCISRTILDRHRGSLSFESAPGMGTTATVTLPQDTPQG